MLKDDSNTTNCEAPSQDNQHLIFSTLVPLSRRNYIFEIDGENLPLAKEKGRLPIMPKHHKGAGSLLAGDLLIVYVRSDHAHTDILRKEFTGVAVVSEPGFELTDIPSYKEAGFALKVKYIEEKRLSLRGAKFIAKFMTNKNIGSQVAFGFFEIYGSDADSLLQGMGLNEKIISHVSA